MDVDWSKQVKHVKKTCFLFPTEKSLGVHQLQAGPSDEVRQVCPGLQTDVEDPASRQSQADHHC